MKRIQTVEVRSLGIRHRPLRVEQDQEVVGSQGIAGAGQLQLLSGHHAEVDKWRRRQNLLLTARRRPDLLERLSLSKEEKEWLSEQLGEGF